MREIGIPVASDEGFEHLGKHIKERGDAMLDIAVYALAEAMAQDKNFDLTKEVNIPYVGNVPVATILSRHKKTAL